MPDVKVQQPDSTGLPDFKLCAISDSAGASADSRIVDEQDLFRWHQEALEEKEKRARDEQRYPPDRLSISRQKLLQTRLDACPVVEDRSIMLSTSVVYDSARTSVDCASLIKNGSRYIPVFSAAYESALLGRAGSHARPDGRGRITYPECSNHAECVAMRFPIRVRGNPGNVRPMILTQLLFEDEYKKMMRDGTLQVESRPCILCLRHALYAFVSSIRRCRKSEDIIQVDQSTLKQTHTVQLDQPGEYDSVLAIHPLGVGSSREYEGFVAPFIPYRKSKLRVYLDGASQRWMVDQSSLLYTPREVYQVRVGETRQSFRLRVSAYTRRSAAANAVISTHDVQREEFVMGYAADALTRDLGNTHIHPNTLRAVSAMYAKAAGYGSKRKRTTVCLNMDLYIIHSICPERAKLGPDLYDMLCYEGTMCDLWVFVHRIGLWSQEPIAPGSFEHLLSKGIPRICKSRKSNTAFPSAFASMIDSGTAVLSPLDHLLLKSCMIALLGNWSYYKPEYYVTRRTRVALYNMFIRGRSSLIRLLRDCPWVAVVAIRELVCNMICDDQITMEQVSQVCDIDLYTSTCRSQGDALRRLIDKHHALFGSDDSARTPASVSTFHQEVKDIASNFSVTAYKPCERNAMETLARKRDIYDHLCDYMHEHKWLDTDESMEWPVNKFRGCYPKPLRPFISQELATLVCRIMKYTHPTAASTAPMRMRYMWDLMRLMCHLCDVEPGGYAELIEHQRVITSKTYGDRKAATIMRGFANEYPRISILCLWVYRAIRPYSEYGSVALYRHASSAQIRACQRAHGDGNGLYINPQSIMLYYSQGCGYMNSPVIAIKQKHKVACTIGMRNAHIELFTQTMYCENHTNPKRPLCSRWPLSRALLLTRFVWNCGKVYTCCGTCGSPMEYNPEKLRFADGYYECMKCTTESRDKLQRDTVERALAADDSNCVICGRDLSLESKMCVYAVYSKYMCLKHIKQKRIIALLKRDDWKNGTDMNAFQQALGALKEDVKEKRQVAMKSVYASRLSKTKQESRRNTRR